MPASFRFVLFVTPTLAAFAGVGCSDFGDSEPAGPGDDGNWGGTDSSVVLLPVRDNTLYENPQADLGNGTGSHLFVGMVGPPGSSLRRRGVLAFDIASSVPSGAVIDSVSLTLHLSNASGLGATSVPIALHRLLGDWGEGSSNALAPGGQGAPAAPGDATWRHTFFDTSFWATEGGDYRAEVSAETVVGILDFGDDSANFYSWTGPRLIDDVQSMLDDPANDFGWILVGNENDERSARRFHTRERSVAAHRPRLFVRFRSLVPGS